MSNTSLLGSYGDNSGAGLMFRNRIINGDMRIDQRLGGSTSATISSAVNTYTLDRWFATGQPTDGVFTIAQSSIGLVGFTKALLATITTADLSIGLSQSYAIGQKIEGFNVADLAWGTSSAVSITLSFRVYSSVAGTFGGSIMNEATNRSYPFTYTIPTINNWATVSVTIPGDTTGTWATDNTSGMRLYFSLGAGSSAKGTAGTWAASAYYSATGTTDLIATNGAILYITGVQLEAGPVATPFERRPYSVELGMCERYTQIVGPSQFTRGSTVGVAETTTSVYFEVPHRVTMRTTPVTVSLSAGSPKFTGAGAANISLPSPVYTGVSSIASRVHSTTATGLTVNTLYALNDTRILCEAEL